jgi:hypothetical protein
MTEKPNEPLTPAEIKASIILAKGEKRKDRHLFLGVPDLSKIRLNYFSDEARAVADAVVNHLREHDHNNELVVVKEDLDTMPMLTVTGPFTIFEVAKKAAQGRVR